MNSVFSSLLDFKTDFNTLPACPIDVVQQVFVSPEQRAEVVELMLAVELLAQRISLSQTASIESYAHAFGIDNHNLRVVRDTALGSHRIAQADLYRNGYWGEIGEIELGAFRMTSSRLPGANLSLLAELGFWQSGTIESVLTGWHRDAFSIDVPGGTERVADAMRRGRECTRDFYIDCDFFEFKDKTVNEICTSWNILPKGVTDSSGWRFG